MILRKSQSKEKYNVNMLEEQSNAAVRWSRAL